MSLRSRSSGVTAGNTVSGQDPFGQPADDGRIDFVPVRYHQSLQGIVTQGRDPPGRALRVPVNLDRKSTRLNSSHTVISYAVFCLKKKKKMRLRELSKDETRRDQTKTVH